MVPPPSHEVYLVFFDWEINNFTPEGYAVDPARGQSIQVRRLGPTAGQCPGGLPDVRCPARDTDIRLFGDGANLTADFPARRDSRVHVGVGSARLDGRDHRGQVLRRQLLGGEGTDGRSNREIGHAQGLCAPGSCSKKLSHRPTRYR